MFLKKRVLLNTVTVRWFGEVHCTPWSWVDWTAFTLGSFLNNDIFNAPAAVNRFVECSPVSYAQYAV